MKVLLINGSPHPHGCTYTALEALEASLQKNGVETEWVQIGKKPMPGCIACGGCRGSGICMWNDDVNDILDELEEIDGIVVGSPVYYSGASGALISFLDRLFYAGGARMAGKVGASVVSCRRGGASATFEQLNQFFLMNNMPLAPSNYWNQIHGNSREEALRDEEGLQTMRQLGENMAWMLRCIAAGRAASVAEPVREPKIATNFIR